MIVLEGPDGSGKSTLARILANVFDTQVFHPGGAPDPKMLEEVSNQCLHKLRQGFICDRVNQVSEVVYGPIMNDRQLITVKQSLDFMTSFIKEGGVIIYCRPFGIENMEDNQTEEEGRDTPENTAKLKANHRNILNGYESLFCKAREFDFIDRGLFIYDYKAKGEFKRLLDFLNCAGRSTKRPSVNEYFINMAHLVATRGTCCRRKVGCVLTDKNKYVLATGYNGRPKGFMHCSEGEPCIAAAVPSGCNLDGCEALHAEQNALLQCKDAQAIETAYVTLFPCLTCTKLLLNTSCKRIVYSEDYVQPEAVELWERAGRELCFEPVKSK